MERRKIAADRAAQRETEILQKLGNMTVNEICTLAEEFTAKHDEKTAKVLRSMPIIERARTALRCQAQGLGKIPVRVY